MSSLVLCAAATSSPARLLGNVVGELRPVTLEETVELAALQTRVDRKYIVAPDLVAMLVHEFGAGLQALEIDGERCFAYESVYFDTPGLDSFRGASAQRRRRWKVRTRTYLGSGKCMLEVKTCGAREETEKDRMPYAIGVRRHLTGPALAFVTERVLLPHGARELTPVLTTTHRRATLLDANAGVRLTVDADLVCTSDDGRSIAMPDHLLVETKSTGAPTAADRLLWQLGQRPMAISKFGVGMACTRPGLPANRWHRPIRRYFRVAAPSVVA